MSESPDSGNGKGRKRSAAKAATRQGGMKIKATIHLSVEASQRLLVQFVLLQGHPQFSPSWPGTRRAPHRCDVFFQQRGHGRIKMAGHDSRNSRPIDLEVRQPEHGGSEKDCRNHRPRPSALAIRRRFFAGGPGHSNFFLEFRHRANFFGPCARRGVGSLCRRENFRARHPATAPQWTQTPRSGRGQNARGDRCCRDRWSQD